MSAALIIPMLPESRLAVAAIGPVPSAAAIGLELRETLPLALMEALSKINNQIEIEILEPLLDAASVEQLGRIFERDFPKFRGYYVSTVFLFWGFLQEDSRRLSELTIRSFGEATVIIRSLGPRWIGEDASSNALQGLATMVRIAKVATRLFDRKSSAEFRSGELHMEQWADSIIAYTMALSSVLSFLTDPPDGRTAAGCAENVGVLANWSRSYATRAYHLTKVVGLLKPTPSRGPIQSADEEDPMLAEAGLERYAELLSQDDRP